MFEVPKNLSQQINLSLQEDIGSGDITAALIDKNAQASATLVTREAMLLCGIPWFDACFQQVSSGVDICWHYAEGSFVPKDTVLAELSGPARALLTAERTALNWLQTLSGTASQTYVLAAKISAYSTILLDTRKTLPGLRAAQKYAVRVGGGKNHRMGLYDQYLIKENHIIRFGSLIKAVLAARTAHPDRIIEVEVETLAELQDAMLAKADVALLDNFAIEDIIKAVKLAQNSILLEVSGNITEENIEQIAKTGVSYISVGALTKHVKAIDLSLRFSSTSC
eukprot:TRINITY_DN30880_c0_g1_i1.p1 TRINITY_DN30880_c0_g1~~TRINITY_DN30880_c0_g1_i1.p1  ORF type:complete len:281 (+),score=-61.73 TRINITY_DN30880_c0_g1_i1:654-1496(+)